MSLSVATTIYIAVDVTFALIRRHDAFPRFGRRGRLLEALIISTAVMVWGWIVAPFILTPMWVGVAGLAMYGLLFIPGFIGLWLLGNRVFLPIGVGGLVFVVTALLLSGVNGILGGVSPTDAFVNSLTIPLIVGNAGAVFIGVYFANSMTDSIRDDRVLRNHHQQGAPFVAGRSESLDSPIHDRNLNDASGINESHPSETPVPSSRSDRVSDTQLATRVYDWQYSPSGFDDIGGYYDVKAELHNRVLEPLRAGEDNDRFSRFGIEPEHGILLYGPPGTGKTLFARALAGELDVPFVELSPADITSMWINESTDQVKTLFTEASELGQCVIFLDEAEHVFGAREFSGASSHAEDKKVTSEFLAQLTREDLNAIVIAATNRPGDVDPAMLRQGRLAAHFEIGLPDEETRHAILQVHLSSVPSSLSGDEIAELAAHTKRMTGADLAGLVATARRKAASRDAATVSREDFPSVENLKI